MALIATIPAHVSLQEPLVVSWWIAEEVIPSQMFSTEIWPGSGIKSPTAR